jgi:hypothetical protein
MTLAPFFQPSDCWALRFVLFAGARREFRIVLLTLRNWGIYVRSERTALEVRAGWENCFRAASILPNQTAHVAEPV